MSTGELPSPSQKTPGQRLRTKFWHLTGHLSSGIFLNFVPSGKAANKIVNCHFDDHYMDIYCYEGSENQIWFNDLQWDGTSPAAKFSYIRVHQDSASPIIGPNGCNMATTYLYSDGSTPSIAYLQQTSGRWGLGVPKDAILSGAKLSLDGHVGVVTDDAYDLGLSANRFRDLYASRNLQLSGKPITYGTAAPTSGTYVVGAIVLNSVPAAGIPLGWECTVAGTPGTWIAIGAPGAWTSVSTFTGTWVSGGSPQAAVSYRLLSDGQHVELAGSLASGAANTAAFTLPTGFRPITQKTLTSYSSGNGGGRGIQVATTGVLTVLAGVTPPISLDGLIFPLDV
jgi:hypothetical protein